MNHSTPADAFVPSMLSFVAMDDTGSANIQKHHQLWDCEYNSQPTTNPIAATNNNNPYLVTAANPFLDCQPSLLPTANLPFYSPMVPDFHLHHHHHHRRHDHYPGLIKAEDCSSDMAGSGQIGLNLGHRTYFPSRDSLAIDRLFQRSRGMYQLTQQVPRCQAEGCKADLSGAKHYHRRHKVCEFHSKATVVVAGGLQQRFCQQCSRFHVLSEFDEAKRSCRKRLADHNRRRRKPQAPTASNPTADPSAPNNSANSCSTEESNKHTTEENARQICSSAGAIFTTTAAVSTFSTSSMSADSHSNIDRNKVSPFSVAPALSLGGAENGGGGGREGFGMHSSSYHHCNNNNHRAFVVMSNEESFHLQHHNHRMSSSSFYHSHHHDFFSSNTNIGASQSTLPGNGSTSGQANNQSNQLLHLGQELFEVDFM